MSNLDSLKGKTILIGKEPGQGRLLIAIVGIVKPGAIGAVGSVSNSVSRCKPAEGIAHCKIVISMDGNMTITNMKPQNVTYVDGIEIVSKHITSNSQVTLGMDRYPINIETVIEVAKKLIEEYSIKHLEKVWNDYDQSILELQIGQAKKGNQQRLIGILQQVGSFSVIIPSVLPQVPIPTWLRAVLIAGAIIMSIYLWQRGNRPDEIFAVQKKKLDEEFQDNYVCPNPKCKRFMGNQPYKIIRQQKGCPICKCKYNEN